ncbi:Wzz/FepE/Etk N-terminal domain-containing protein [Pseudomonas sp.]|uniref:LPS O-antigen chain length determinant protein WzzB n=1 Tax=Pseudomonas sp. TaxID=306 RepID=UPI00289A7D92|nr:Wzz/FepE/Etk N-terminal domain-containing protein [Pseudomonas sp.]
MRIESERLREQDDLDLIELFGALWRRKRVIVASVLVITGMAAAYALLSQPVYEAKVYVQPPTKNDIAALNQGRNGERGLEVYSTKDVYAVYLRALQSDSLRRAFFRDTYLPTLSDGQRQGSQDRLFARFNELLTVALASKETPDRFYVQALTEDPNVSAQWIGRYVEMASERAKRTLIKDALADAAVVADNLQEDIAQARASARRMREDEIVRLSESLNVAQSIGLELPPLISGSMATEISADADGALTYMRGSKALQAEIENLQSRESDDPFVDKLRQRQEELMFYRGLRIHPDAFAVYQTDGAVEVPDSPVKPRKAMIIGGGLFIGLLMGVGLALLSSMVASARRREPGQR